MLTLPQTQYALQILLGISLLIQTLEFWRLSEPRFATGVWSWQIQKDDLGHASPWLRHYFTMIYGDRLWRLHLVLRLGLILSALLLGFNLLNVGLLFMGTLYLLIRWRGAFNGGSDFMTIVVLTGLVVVQLGQIWVDPAVAWTAGLWYITIHTISSYFLSGAVKLFYDGWRDGRAIIAFLDGAIYGPLAADSVMRKPVVAVMCSWAFILWECSFPMVLLGADWAVVWCAIAVLFHFLVFWFFGLNRFFWAWCVTFPAVIYCAGQLSLVYSGAT